VKNSAPAWLRDLADGDADALEVLVRALRDFYGAVVAPRWDSVVVSFHADVARRMPVLAAGGHQALFDTLHPQLRWRDEGLERLGYDGEWGLSGGGLVLIPSAFQTCREGRSVRHSLTPLGRTILGQLQPA
jgi:hypothetical protein